MHLGRVGMRPLTSLSLTFFISPSSLQLKEKVSVLLRSREQSTSCSSSLWPISPVTVTNAVPSVPVPGRSLVLRTTS